MVSNDHDLLIAKLDAFIRKFYKDQLIRGLIYAVGLILVVFLAVIMLEHLGRFGTGTRTLLFWGTLAAMLLILVRYVAVPLVKLFRLGSTIGHDQAARIIGTHFAEVQDKLLNTLQLRDMAQRNAGNRALIEAAIAQRSRELGPIPFVNAIDLRRNTRYLRYALPPLALLLVLLFAAPSIVTGPTQRLIRHGSEFVPEAPFRFVLLNESLEVPEEQDLEVVVELQGDIIPQQVELEVQGQRIPMVKRDATRFTHRFRNVQRDTEFKLTAEGFHSPTWKLVTVPDPMLLDFSLALDYPSYLGRPNETLHNTGDLRIPAGTRVSWSVNARSADQLDLVFDDTTLVARTKVGAFQASRRFLQGRTYRMVPGLADAPTSQRRADDALQYRVEVVPDLYPTIQVESRTDSTALKRLFFRGEIADDHGLKRLLFHYRFTAGATVWRPSNAAARASCASIRAPRGRCSTMAGTVRVRHWPWRSHRILVRGVGQRRGERQQERPQHHPSVRRTHVEGACAPAGPAKRSPEGPAEGQYP